MRIRRSVRYALMGIGVLSCAGFRTGFAIDDVGGTLVTLTDSTASPNGAWSWFEDERAIIDDSDPNNTKLLVSSVSYASNGSERGDIDLLWLNVDTGAKGHFELNDRLEVPDDHNSAALWRRPSDGRYVAMYSTHNNDDFSRYRISTNPSDPTSWQPEVIIDNQAPTTYSNLYHLPNEGGPNGRTYNFTRASNFDPTILISADQGNSWTSSGYKLVNRGNSSQRPYARYFSDGSKIHVTITEEHPRNFDNSIYHAYIQNGQLFSSTGTVLDSNLFNSSARDPSQLTPVFTTGTEFGGVAMQRAWTTDIAIDNTGHPVAVFSARAEDNDADHRFFYARFDGSNWNVNELAKAGGFLYSPENDYTGLVSIDPNDTNTVFISSNIDPRSNQTMPHYEIFRGGTNDGGLTWNWDPITFNSTVDNLRPLVPEWNTSETALVWMRGTYTTFQDWDSEVVVLTDITPLNTAVSTADLDNDGDVDFNDFGLFLPNLHSDLSGLTVEQAEALGDFDGNLQIDFADLTFFRQEFDMHNGAGQFRSVLAIPEPATPVIASILLLGFVNQRAYFTSQFVSERIQRNQRASLP